MQAAAWRGAFAAVRYRLALPAIGVAGRCRLALPAIAVVMLLGLGACQSPRRAEPPPPPRGESAASPHGQPPAHEAATSDAPLPPGGDLMRADHAAGMAAEDAEALRLRPASSQPAAPRRYDDPRRPRLNAHRRVAP